MVVTALDPRIRYDSAVKIGKPAVTENTTLKQAAEQRGHVRREHLDRRVLPAAMTRQGNALPGDGD
jgi:fumarate hydratase, class II